jgi:hypothetical protein
MSIRIFCDRTFTYAQYEPLIELGVLEEVPENELERGDTEPYAYGIRITGLGVESREYLLAIITEFVNELGATAEN